MVTLGLDISTSCIGYAFTEDKKILDMGFIDIKKQKTPRNKVFFVLEFLNNNSYIDSVEKIYVEDNLSGFAGGRTSQQTIVKLAKFNAILCFVLEDTFEIEVKNINPMTARKNVFGKARVKGIKAKEFVKKQVENLYDTSKWCKTTTRGNWDKRNIDMYDGLVMSLFEEQ
jgi:RNase H-fold protein (predicted Holliday junction resolvase)